MQRLGDVNQSILTGASKCAEPAKGGSQGVGGAKSIIGGVTIVERCFRHVWACARLLGHQEGS